MVTALEWGKWSLFLIMLDEIIAAKELESTFSNSKTFAFFVNFPGFSLSVP